MRGSGTRALTGLSVLAFVLCSILSAAPARAGDGLNVEPSVNAVINFPAFPNAGGPYITQATVRPTSVSGAPATEVYLVFNEPLAGGSVAVGDFAATGFTFTSVTVSGNTVTLDDATGAASGDAVRLSGIGVIDAVDGSSSTDLSTISVNEGPVILEILALSYKDTIPNNDTLCVIFDEDVRYGGGDSEDNTFNLTPEFNGATLASQFGINDDATGDTLYIYRDAGATDDFRMTKPGVTKLWVEAEKIVWDQSQTTDNSVDAKIVVNNIGPHILAAYYNDNGTPGTTDDVLWPIMSEPVDPSSIVGGLNIHFDSDPDGGAWAPTDGVVQSAFPGFITSSLQVTNIQGAVAPPVEGTDFIANHNNTTGTSLLDYQGLDGDTLQIHIDVGPGVIRASYDDRQTSSRNDDQLFVWINEVLTANASATDFSYIGFDGTGLTVITETIGSLTRITFTGFDALNYPTPGSRILADTTDGTPLTGAISGDPIADNYPICVEDESRPFSLNINEDLDLTYDVWDAGGTIDSVFIAWSESGGDDSDQYFMFYSATTGLDDTWMNANLLNAVPLGNLQSEATDVFTRIGFTVDPGVTLSTDGNVLNTGDQMTVIIAAADYQGNLARVQDSGNAAQFFGPFIVGPLCSPRDFITDVSSPAEPDSSMWDHDIIHVVGDSTGGMVWHYVYGDSGAIACDADSVVVYDGPDETTDNWLGSIPVNPGGGFSPIHLGSPEVDCIYVFSRQGAEFSVGTAIIYDRDYPEIRGDLATPYPDYVFDPWNPYRCYNADDYVNIRLLANDPVGAACGLGPVAFARNSLMHIWADFTQIDATGGNISGFGTPADSILFTSLGADQVDNDGDWDNFTDVDGNGDWDPGEPLNDDVGLDGVGGTNDPGEGDGMMTFGDPYIDENGDGDYDAGETFLNVFTDADGSSGRLIYDPGEIDLDSNDSDEHGWYEIASSSSSVRGTVRQGYRLNNPIADAQLDPFTPVPIYMEDNGIDGNRRADSPDRTLPFTDAVTDSNRTLAHVTFHNGGDAERRFAARLDLREPTHGEITYLASETGQGTDGADNLIAPGNPTYNLGRWVDFTSSTLSDDDVLFNRVRINPGLAGWEDLVLDPPGDRNGDNFPGMAEYDEDADSTATQANGVDDDEDGEIDEVGEGIDFSDRELHAAAQDSTADEAATYGNLLHCQNDFTDNDNDAFFVYDSYANGGLVGGGDVGKVFWYNIDESRTNQFDDDNDGSIDEADEEPENVGYGNGEDDCHEDGIIDGEAIAVPINTAFSVLAIDDPVDPRWASPTPGTGVSGAAIMVDAAHILGTRPQDAAGNGTNFYDNGLSYGEVVGAAYEVMTESVRLFAAGGYDFGGGADSASTNAFNWSDTHTIAPHDGNLDFELVANVYGLSADGVTGHQIRAVAYDKCGNVREPWSEPISFTLDLTAPPATIPGCNDIGDPPPDFADVDPDRPGIQVYDAGKHPNDYTLTAETDDDAVSVTFEVADNPDFDPFTVVSTDITAPFTTEWPGTGMYVVNNYPAANSDTVYFRARATDEFGNSTQDADLCVLTIEVIDGTNPTAKLTQIDDDDWLHDGACVPPDSSIHLFADIWDNDEDAAGDTLDWVGGLDMASGDVNIDDDGNGGTDEDDVDGDGIYTEGVDEAGVDGIPGTDDDEWNGSSFAGNYGETDDYITNDITHVVFEYNPVGDTPDLGWLPIETVHGDTFSTGGQTVDWTTPVFATWNTLDLETGDYDIRAYACDIEGNCDDLTAFITTVCIQAEPLRAYIQPEICQPNTQFDLYAVHYIHDYEIDRVRFEYWADTDGDNCATALDVGSSWVSIDTDDDGSGRGDAVLYMPSAERLNTTVDAIEDLAYRADLSGTMYMYWDPDNDGYSHRDPVVLDDGDGIFDDGDDDAVIGDDGEIPDGATLTAFASDEFYADGTANGTLDDTDWIFRENQITGTNGTLELWMVTWDATGLDQGNYLVRSVAIDETNQEDVMTTTCYDPAQQNPEEIEAVTVDTEDPDADFTTITLPDGTVLDVSNPVVPPYVSGVNRWLQICAAGSSDLARVLFEYSLDGGADWDTLVFNNDYDFYADVNDTLGFQALGGDEIFNDLNGNFVFDGEDVDFVRYDGGDGVDTPIGYPLNPLMGEDPINAMDDDGDGEIDEDPMAGDPDAGEPGSPQVYDEPFCAYLDIHSLMLWADVNVLFRATASDLVCENYRDDPDPDLLAVIIGENMPPEADIIRAEDENGDEIDVFPPIMDDNGVACISSATDTMHVHVTAEDITAIVSVDLMYRLDPSCYTLTFEERQWKSMSAEGWTSLDLDYPYNFKVDTGMIPDGSYQMYPMGIDEGGNATLPPTNPWEFKKFADASEDFAFVSDPTGTPPDTVAVGDEYTIMADLTDPNATGTTAVRFYFAPRRLDESIDPTTVQPIAPFLSETLDQTVLSADGCDGVVLTINGDVQECGVDYTLSGNAIAFTTRPDGSDDVMISYNFGSWVQVNTGDEFDPYTVEWSNADGGVPAPGDNGWSATDTNAYDLIAQARFDLNGDWLFDGGTCDVDETLMSEGNYVVLEDLERPLVQIWGLAYSDDNRNNQGAYPDWNTPGNPLFTCGDDVNESEDWDNAFILSGKETDVFVTATDQGGGDIDMVSLKVSADDPSNGGNTEMSWDMSEITTSSLSIPVTFYPEDYPQWGGDDIENVILYISTDGGSTFPIKYEMADSGSCWQANATFTSGVNHRYEFEVDLDGDTQTRILDARNNDGSYSAVNVPSTPFWYLHIDSDSDLYPARVHHAVATATDDSGNTGTNLNSGTPSVPGTPQGPVVFIYDTEAPVFGDPPVTAMDDTDHPIMGTRVSPANTYHLWASVNDDPFEDFNVLRVDQVMFQYSPNMGEAWITIGTDTNTTDGWSVSWTPVNGRTDGYDNNGNGVWDEADEVISDVMIRAIAWDCGYNTVYSTNVTLEVDAAEPSACPTTPVDGMVFGYADAIDISGMATGDWIPAQGGTDIAEMRFEARFSNLYFVDETYNGVGHGGDFDNGIDEIWEDTNSNGLFDGGDTNRYPGADNSASTPTNGSTNRWFTLDPTPQDNSDDPWLTAPNNGDAFDMTWTPVTSAFTAYGQGDAGNYVDEYVRIRMVATDTAGNEDTDADDNPPCEKLIILDDEADNNPRAYVMEVDTHWVDPVECFVMLGDGERTIGGSVSGTEALSHVNVYVTDSSDNTSLIAVDNTISADMFSITWDVTNVAQGEYTIFATVVDWDDNESDPSDATSICVSIDRDGPAVEYACTDGGDWVSSIEYVDDGIEDHSSFAIHPDMYTWDVLFCVNTGDADVATIRLQWRNADDPAGLWRPLNELLTGGPSGLFDYEPNLNFDRDGSTRHVWRLHVEDWPTLLIAEGAMQFRALATDGAGNTNALDPLTNAQDLTADGTGPTLYDWNDDSVTNQVEVGSTVHFEISAEDNLTDVHQAQLQYRNVTDSGSWTVYEGSDEPTGVQIDSGMGVWIFEFDWVAPSWVIHDTVYEFRLVTWDSGWNESTNTPPHAFQITVEDNAAPDRTKIYDIVGEVNYHSEDGNPADPSDDHKTHDVYQDLDGDDDYTSADYLISEGGSAGIQDPNGSQGIATVGDVCNTFPRWVGESFLNDPNDRNEVKVASDVTIVGRTWADDDGIDAGIAYVTFWAQALDDSDNPVGDPMLIGRDEVAPFFPLYYWHLTWNTLEEDIDGNRVYADGRYRLGAHAIDQEGNEEDMSSLDWTAAIVVVDNEAPEAVMDADPATAEFENTLTVERNEWFTLYSRVLEPGSTDEITTEDDTITWYFKRSRDLNMSDSWGMVPGFAGLTPEDGNPDATRPYSFDVRVGLLTDPTDPTNDPALAVGENYDFIMSVMDEVCNTTSHISAFADSATIGARHLKVKIVDTIAPHLEFVSATRALPTRDGVTYGDGTAIVNPTQVHAQAFASITARLLTGDRDIEYVEFAYRKMGDTDWNLIDADITMDSETDWMLGAWDLRALDNNSWYEVAVVGVDNVGNVDQNPDIMKVYVDYEAPDFAVMAPAPSDETNRLCDYEITSAGRIHDLIIEVMRGDAGVHDDVYDVTWEWKLSTADSTMWSAAGVATSDDLYDDTLNYYSNTINLNNLSGTNLYDFRITLEDEAGNTNKAYIWKKVLDLTDPDYIQVSNIYWEGDDTTQDPSDQDQYTDVTAGTMVEIFGTASDDEDALPNYRDPLTDEWYETAVEYMQFQVAVDLPLGAPDGDDDDGEEWRDLGTINFDPDDLDDISAQTASVYWNTSGLAEGQYLIRVGAIDECQNPNNDYAWSDLANVRVVDHTPPIARVICWDGDMQPHGENPPGNVTVYALAESDPNIRDVQFQYNIADGESVPTGDWVNFGVQDSIGSADGFTTEILWYSTIDLTQFDTDVTTLWVRALAVDDAGNRYGDNPEDAVPTIQLDIVQEFDGTYTFAYAENGDDLIEDVEVMIESATQVIVTVDMATADETPRVVLLAERTMPDTYPSDDNPTNYSPYSTNGLTRSLNDPTVWRGEISLEDDYCYHYKICVTAIDGTEGTAMWIDHDGAWMREYDVTQSLGTNGTVYLPAYDGLGVSVDIHPGAWPDSDACMLISPTWAPIVSHDEDMYLTTVDNTAYHIEITSGNGPFNHGYEALVVVEYDDADAQVALDGANAEEMDLTVRRWDTDVTNGDGTSGAWIASGISHVQVDTMANTISFRVDNLVSDSGNALNFAGGPDSYGNIFQVFAPKDSAPVFFSSVWPNSPYVNDWWTDADPVVVTYLRDPGGQGVNASEVELLIDGEYWATWLDGEGSADWIRGNGKASLESVNNNSTVMELVYQHSNYGRDWLEDGPHTLTIRFRSDSGEWLDGDQILNVDRTSPYIEFDGGWVKNPDLINVAGYMNPANDSLMVKLYDEGTGILFKHDKKWYLPDNDCDGSVDADELQYDPMPFPGTSDDGYCWHQVDWGIKYDLWLVDPNEDDQRDIDEIEERILIHQGTADELAPWISPRLEVYNPATDTLMVPVPVLGGGLIEHNDILEITWYSEKTIEANSDGPGYQLGCWIDTVWVGDQIYYMYDSDCAYDYHSQEMHIYDQGILDWAGNTGSKYVEQRFIVDMEPPNCQILSPGATVDPEGDMMIHAVIDDDGSGTDDGSITVEVIDPEGNVVEEHHLEIEDGEVVGHIEGPLTRGEYTLKISASDALGNKCNVSRSVRAESAQLAMTQAHAYPNPFNPSESHANVSFSLTKPAEVTVKVYDFGGNYVATLETQKWYEGGMVSLPWGGEAEDGTDLANGTYIARVVATDGIRTEESNLKVVIWRE